ncbi:maltose permease [Suillus lakei]|nr:maltose permease [Suillus lakei]
MTDTVDEKAAQATDATSGFEKESPYGNLTALAQAAATEHAITPAQAMRTYWRAFAWCLFINMGALLWGYDSQIGGGLLSVPSFRRDFGSLIDQQYVLAASWQSAFNSVSSIGGMAGAFSLGYISELFGRRGAVAVACSVSIVGILLQFLTPAHNNGNAIGWQTDQRFLAWFDMCPFNLSLSQPTCVGMFVSSAGSYCAEVSPLALRGITTASVNLWIDRAGSIVCSSRIFIGTLLNGKHSMSNGVIRGTGNRTDVYAYRLPFALQWIFPIILLVGLPFAPESPWWLVRKGEIDDARKVITRLGGPTIDADVQLQQIQYTIELEDSYAASARYIDCFRGVNLRRTIVATMVFVLQQGAGVVFVLGFSTYFFELAGFANTNAFNLGIGVTAIGIVGNLLTFYTVNRFGRRFIFFWGMLACTTVLLLIGFISISHTQNARWTVAAFTIIYNFIYQTGIWLAVVPLGYVIFAEVSSAKLRSKTVALGIWVNSLCGMVVNIVVPVNPDQANLGGYVGFIFGGLAFAGTIWTWYFIPETKDRTVDELDVLFEQRVPAYQFATYDLLGSNSPSI